MTTAGEKFLSAVEGGDEELAFEKLAIWAREWEWAEDPIPCGPGLSLSKKGYVWLLPELRESGEEETPRVGPGKPPKSVARPLLRTALSQLIESLSKIQGPDPGGHRVKALDTLRTARAKL